MARFPSLQHIYLIGLLIIGIVAASCGDSREKSTQESKKGKYFQGEITYTFEYEAKVPLVQISDLENAFGSSCKLVFKEGNYKLTYFSPDGSLIKESILDLKSKKSFTHKIGSDTVYWYDISMEDPFIMEFTTRDDTLVNDLECYVIDSHVKLRDTLNTPDRYEVHYSTLFAKKLRIDPDWYRDFSVESYNELTRMVRSLKLEETYFSQKWISRKKCNSIVWRKVHDNELSIDHLSSKVFIKY